MSGINISQILGAPSVERTVTYRSLRLLVNPALIIFFKIWVHKTRVYLIVNCAISCHLLILLQHKHQIHCIMV